MNLARSSSRSQIDTLSARFSALYSLAQTNPRVFASPIGPMTIGRRSISVPRFVFFGPHASDDSWRLALMSGFDPQDSAPVEALLDLIQALAIDANAGHGLNLTFFPLVDAAGFAEGTAHRDSSHIDWTSTTEPAIELIRRDIRSRGYHGFIRLESAEPGELVPVLSLRTRGEPPVFAAGEFLDPAAFASSEVRFERIAVASGPTFGPLDLADDLGFEPFELTLRVPPPPHLDDYFGRVVRTLSEVLARYRAYQAYGGHL